MEIIVADNAASLAYAAARRVGSLLESELASVEAGGRISLGLAGGSTPRATYERLREIDLPWTRIHAWLGDERWVPHDHPDNNGRMARDTLANHVPLRLHPVPYTPNAAPGEAARAYAVTLSEIIAHDEGRLRPEVVMLGVGTDGHTASLFPETRALAETVRPFVANPVEAVEGWRLTATLPLLHAARHLLFLASGAGKADAVRRVIEDPDREDLPARRAMQGNASVTWFLDRESASMLEEPPARG